MKEQGSKFTWDPCGDLYFWHNRPPCIQHPETGEKIWFNQATTLNCSYYRLLPGWDEIPDHKQPSHTCYRDGSDIEPNLVPRAHVPFGQHQDTELWNSQQARSQHLRVVCF